eukprot:Pompholyxophrys_punicea_v1_NODE_186_length_2908_cov_28.244304.p1 type:complete len:703 gc:universal NODE_186_length_2908_cov_28.244304:800-2908(+)
MPPQAALALFYDLGLTKEKYILLRENAAKYGAPYLYPSYDELSKEKKKCYPQNRVVEPFLAKVPLQDLLDHTTGRLLHLSFDALKLSAANKNMTEEIAHLTLTSKWGFDGSSGHSVYAQGAKDYVAKKRAPASTSFTNSNISEFPASLTTLFPVTESDVFFPSSSTIDHDVLPIAAELTNYWTPDLLITSSYVNLQGDQHFNDENQSVVAEPPLLPLPQFFSPESLEGDFLAWEDLEPMENGYDSEPAPPMQDKALFSTSLVPLVLKYGEDIIWKNPTPGASTFCRPIEVQFVKEDREISQLEETAITQQIQDLKCSSFTFEGTVINVRHQLLETMVDGKASNNLTETGNNTCRLCGAKPSEMNDWEMLKKKVVSKDRLKYGMHTLHLWIRSLEYFLAIAYRLNTQSPSYSRITPEATRIQAETKKSVQNALWKEMGLIVDQPIPGSSNTGNTARRFFQNPALAAKATGLNEGLIKMFQIYLRTLCCPYKLNVAKVKEYGEALYKKCIETYSWWWMPSSLHIALRHGWEFVELSLFSDIPMGWWSEEASESSNKELKRARLLHARKNSRRNNLEDMFSYRLGCTDPIMASLNFERKQKRHYQDSDGTLPKEILQMLDTKSTIVKINKKKFFFITCLYILCLRFLFQETLLEKSPNLGALRIICRLEALPSILESSFLNVSFRSRNSDFLCRFPVNTYSSVEE